MKKIDYEESVQDNEPCKHLATILKLVSDKYNISRQDLMVLLEVHALKEFTWDDFATAELTASWEKKRFYRWKNDGFIELYRAKKGKFQRYNIYRCTRKAKTMVIYFYNLINDKEAIPVVAYNKKHTYSSNRLALKTTKLNKENHGTPTQET